MRRILVGAAVTAFLGLAFLVRVLPAWSAVFSGPAGVRLFDTDSYYHLRHARYAAAHFPHLQDWDPGLYPSGQPKRYAGLFDVTIGGAALVASGGHPTDGTLSRVAAFTPPVLGILASAALFWLATRARCAATGLVALAFVTLYPGGFVQRSLLGAVDHHVAEVLLSLLTALGLLRSVSRGVAPRRPSGDPATEPATPWSRARPWLPDLVSPLPLAVFFFTWFGAPIYVVLVAVTYFGVGVLISARDGAAQPVARAAFRYGAGLLVLLGAARAFAPGLVMESSYFGKALLAVVLFAAGVPAYLVGSAAVIRRATGTGRARARLFMTLGSATAALIALAVAMALVPEARRLLGDLLDVKTDLVKEQASIGLARYAFLGGAPAFLAFGALPLAVWASWKSHGRRDPLGADRDPADDLMEAREVGRFALALFATCVVLLWLRTRDYGYVAPPFLAWLAADVVVRIAGGLRRPHPRVAAGLVAVTAAATIFPVWPAALAGPAVPDRSMIRELMVLRPGWEQALAWMKEATPSLRRSLDAPVPEGRRFRHPVGNYGVLAFWDFGHYVAELARRPPVASGGISTSTAKWFLMTDEDRAVSALAHGLSPGEQVRYCIADAQTAGDFLLTGLQMAGEDLKGYVDIFVPGSMPDRRLMRFSDRYAGSMIARLYEGDGADLAHFRLVYASPEQNLLAYHAPRDGGAIVRKATPFSDAEEAALWRGALASHRPVVLSDEIVYDGRIGPAVKVFEQVAGARLVGRAPPGALLEARLELTARASSHAFRYVRSGRADADGHFELTVPYPTDPAPVGSDMAARAPYEIYAVGPAPANIVVGRATVAADDVEQGLIVQVAPVP